jgi:DNA-binding Lrp family transcriptional regulator
MIKIHTHKLDDIDKAILKIVQTQANIKESELARRVNLSAPATHQRLKHLQDEGYIRQFVALLDREKMGFGLLCFVQISLPVHQANLEGKVQETIVSMPEVLECFQVTGEQDYLLKVALRDQKHLRHFLNEQLTPMLGSARISTQLVLNEIKSKTELNTEMSG